MTKSITIAPSIIHLSASLNLPTEINGPFSDIKVYGQHVFSISNEPVIFFCIIGKQRLFLLLLCIC